MGAGAVIHDLTRPANPLERHMRTAAAALVFCGLVASPAAAESGQSAAAEPCATVAITGEPARCIAPGSGRDIWFKDCPACPEMVVVPGAPPLPAPDDRSEPPEPRAPAFAVGRFAVTFEEWDACVADLGCNAHVPSDQGWGRGRHPVINVGWADAVAYAEWLSQKTGERYRLPGAAEREHVTRAGTATVYWWGDGITLDQANFDLPISGRLGTPHAPGEARPRGRTVPVDSFEPNPWGLFNVHGNVWEWTSDCAPADGPVIAEPEEQSEPACGTRLAQGGSWHDFADAAQSANSIGFAADTRNFAQGFRVARDLP